MLLSTETVVCIIQTLLNNMVKEEVKSSLLEQTKGEYFCQLITVGNSEAAIQIL